MAMFKPTIKVKKNSLIWYWKRHSKGLSVSIGIFDEKNKRKETTGTSLVDTAYGKERQGTGGKVKVTNSMIAKTAVEGYEKGDYKIPIRNFFLLASDKKYWETSNFNFLKHYFKAHPQRDLTTNRLGNLGKVIIKQAITDLRIPPNAEATIEEKGQDNPLVDSGQLRASIGFKKFPRKF